MGLYADLITAEAEVDRLKAELDTARANRDAIKARLVLEGPDVSQFQGAIDWTAPAIGFVFHRTSDGDVRDTSWQKSRVDGVGDIPLGVYHYARVASDGNRQRNGKSEAAMAVYFAESMGWGRAGDLPLAYDFETLNGQSPAKAAAHVTEFCAAYEYLKGHRPILYTNPAAWALVEAEVSNFFFAQLPLWIAHWGVTEPEVPDAWADWTFWQYTSTGTLPGITGAVDLNRFNGTNAHLTALRI